jgi:hypothetical protein
MNLEVNDYKVLIGALQSISIKGSDARYISSLLVKLENLSNELEIKVQEEDTPKKK